MYGDLLLEYGSYTESLESLFIDWQNTEKTLLAFRQPVAYRLPVYAGNPVSVAISDHQARCKRHYDWTEKKRQAAASLYRRMKDNTPERESRFALTSMYPTRKAQYKAAGHANAVLLAQARSDNSPESDLWIDVFFGPLALIKRIPDPPRVALIAAGTKLAYGAWARPTWEKDDEFVGPFAQSSTTDYRRHFCHVSLVDPTQVAYYPSLAYLIAGREVRTKPGRYLTKYFSHMFTEAQIRQFAQRFVQENAPPEVHFVEDDDPDGWEWVYEHGSGFTSCMVYNRPNDRHLESGLYGENHPVRAYAYKGNGLRLAWLGHGFKTDEGKVFARAIIDPSGGFVRTYGDDRLYATLRAMGMHSGGDLYGVKLARREYDGRIICPYLDGADGVDDYGSYLVVQGDRCEYECTSTGLCAPGGVVCDECGAGCHEDDMTWVGRGDDVRVCERCLDHRYTYAIGRRGDGYYVHNDSVVECDGEFYDVEYLSNNEVFSCDECEGYYKLDDLHPTQNGMCCEDCGVALDVDDSDGNSFAPRDDTVETYDGRTIHGDDEVVIERNGECYSLHKDDDPDDYLSEEDDEDDEDDLPVVTHVTPPQAELPLAAYLNLKELK